MPKDLSYTSFVIYNHNKIRKEFTWEKVHVHHQMVQAQLEIHLVEVEEIVLLNNVNAQIKI